MLVVINEDPVQPEEFMNEEKIFIKRSLPLRLSKNFKQIIAENLYWALLEGKELIDKMYNSINL